MMNLSELQEQLKSMPDQYLQGVLKQQNGEVPQFLALGEVSRRQRMRQAPQAQQGPAPSIKDQLLGVAALPRRGGAMPVPSQGQPPRGFAGGGVVSLRGFAGGGLADRMADDAMFKQFLSAGRQPQSPMAGRSDLMQMAQALQTGVLNGQPLSPQDAQMFSQILEAEIGKTTGPTPPVSNDIMMQSPALGSVSGESSGVVVPSMDERPGMGSAPLDVVMSKDAAPRGQYSSGSREDEARIAADKLRGGIASVAGAPGRAIESAVDALERGGANVMGGIYDFSASGQGLFGNYPGAARMADQADQYRRMGEGDAAPQGSPEEQRLLEEVFGGGDSRPQTSTPARPEGGGIADISPNVGMDSSLRPQARPDAAAPAADAGTTSPSRTVADDADIVGPQARPTTVTTSGQSVDVAADTASGIAAMSERNKANEGYKVDVMSRMSELDRLQKERAADAFDYALIRAGSAMAGAQTPWGSQAFAAGMDAGTDSLQKSQEDELAGTKEMLGIEAAYEAQQQKMALARMAAAARARRGGGSGSGSVGGSVPFRVRDKALADAEAASRDENQVIPITDALREDPAYSSLSEPALRDAASQMVFQRTYDRSVNTLMTGGNYGLSSGGYDFDDGVDE